MRASEIIPALSSLQFPLAAPAPRSYNQGHTRAKNPPDELTRAINRTLTPSFVRISYREVRYADSLHTPREFVSD